MTKQSGVGSALWFGSADISGDIGAVTSAEHSRGEFSVSAIDKSAEERILLRHDGSMGFTSFWNTSAGQAHLTLSALPRTDVQVTLAIGAAAGAVGQHAASMIAKQTNYAPAFGDDGSLVATIGAVANGTPLEWGELLTTGKQTFASGSVNGTSVDMQTLLGAGTSTAFGCAAYLHVFSLGSGTPTLTIKDSANDSAFTALSPTSLAFTPTVAGVERQATGVTATVRRYVRVEVTGTYTALVCALSFVRYTEAQS